MEGDTEKPTDAAETVLEIAVEAAAEVATEAPTEAAAEEGEATDAEPEQSEAAEGEEQQPEGAAKAKTEDQTDNEEDGEKTEEQRKAERRERLKAQRDMRFKTGDSVEEIITSYVPYKADEEQEEEEEGDDGLTTLQTEYTSATSSSTSSSASAKSDISEQALDALLNLHSDNEDEDEDEDLLAPPQGADTVKAKADFLNFFDVPSLSDISEDVSIVQPVVRKSRKQKRATEVDPTRDEGKFVDRLTGQPLDEDEEELPVEEEQEKPAESTESSSSSDDSDKLAELDLLPGIQSFVQPTETADAMEVFVHFQQSFIKPSSIVVDEGEIEAMRQKREVLQITIDFLFELFNNVVTEAENVHADTALKAKLNNEKLLDKMIDMRDRLYFEKEINQYLNSKMGDYYKRAKNFRVFSKMERTASEVEHTRYKQALVLVDHNMKLAAEAKKKNAYLMSSVLMDLQYVQNIAFHSEEHLEETIMRTLVVNNSDHLRRLVEMELKRMNLKRNEISDTRLFLITRKHTLARITDKIKKLEQINEDLCIDDFIAIQNQVVALDKKIEERNNDLKKLRYNYHTELHLTQHNREKALSLVKKLDHNKFKLRQQRTIQRNLRESLYQAKLNRGRMRKQHSDLSFQGGLLSMPALMHDYDVTVAKVEAKQLKLRELRENCKRVKMRITELETRCT
ncbi:CG4714 [Drosophila busckii]|uniref:CG4714 n=1 Tax=Drosophila busckii TaxID=30019 RepID=A0A0M4EUK7_DROBS|nr:uncharacterized protein LOC108595071 [Drosophila busckii]ALC41132.1 CG4714 [Drosophila busckii]